MSSTVHVFYLMFNIKHLPYKLKIEQQVSATLNRIIMRFTG